jgi:hypothetical protein
VFVIGQARPGTDSFGNVLCMKTTLSLFITISQYSLSYPNRHYKLQLMQL